MNIAKWLPHYFKNKLQHSLVEMSAMLACISLLIILFGLIVFVSIQGGRYFLPMSTYKIVTYMPAENTATASRVNYVLSHDSASTLLKNIENKLAKQYVNAKTLTPTVSVNKADDLYLLTTQAGKKYLGHLNALLGENGEPFTLSQLNSVMTTVNTLSANRTDIQLSRLQALHKEIDGFNKRRVSADTPAFARKLEEFARWQQYANTINKQIQQYAVQMLLANEQIVSIPIISVQSLYKPNTLSVFETIKFTFSRLFEFLSESPKQAATSGGVFPAIFGTLLMVILMAVFVTPFGIIAAIYLHEYAPPNKLTTFIRISVSNMAAVPSVVYGVFGLGFFVYAIGGSIDQLLFSSTLPSPTFGAPGLLWAALTMGILTLPVVIVATEEGLSRVPNNLRAGALALGATKYETIRQVVVPMASPGMLTGVILAIARAAGEVAPLILVGAVKFAPTLPIDSEFPFVHLERQFMHLGVFIYDGAFHNQTESQVSSLMFATCMLLLLIVFLLNVTAIFLRNKLRKKYKRLSPYV